jgi:hypothetical protein
VIDGSPEGGPALRVRAFPGEGLRLPVQHVALALADELLR